MIKSNRLKKQINFTGFTLVEIIIVIALLGIVATISTPLLLNYLPNMRLKSASRDLFSAMQEARMIAIKNNKPTAILFNNSGDANPTNDNYALYDDPGPDDDWGTIADNNLIKTTNLVDYNSSVQYGHLGLAGTLSVTGGAFPADHVSYPGNRVVFNERGTCSGGYVYLDNGTSLYAVGSRSSGFIALLRWHGGTTWE